ncbi:MAG: hypothetical protein ACLQBD_18455 [Syntrophobacteraceae bacterium]
MKGLLPIIFATIAAIGNAIFALGQKKSAGVKNGLLLVGVSALVAALLAFFSAPLVGAFDLGNTLKENWKAVLLSGLGLFLTYLGFNLLYTRYGASQYILYSNAIHHHNNNNCWYFLVEGAGQCLSQARHCYGHGSGCPFLNRPVKGIKSASRPTRRSRAAEAQTLALVNNIRQLHGGKE